MGMAPLRRVLVVDDDDDIRLLLQELLTGAGYRVETAPDGRAALRVFHENPADLVVLDLSMPELDGFQTLERIRDLSDVPVILLTARSGEIDKVRGFRAGAYDDGALSIDYAQRLVLCRGLPVRLTPLEFRLLDAFTRHPGQVLSADQLVEQCWGHEAGVSRDQVKLYVSYVRKKLAP